MEMLDTVIHISMLVLSQKDFSKMIEVLVFTTPLGISQCKISIYKVKKKKFCSWIIGSLNHNIT